MEKRGAEEEEKEEDTKEKRIKKMKKNIIRGGWGRAVSGVQY